MGSFQQQPGQGPPYPQDNQYPHSAEAYGAPVASPPPHYPQQQQQQQQQYFQQDQQYQQQSVNHTQQPNMAYQQQQPMAPEKQHQHAPAQAYQQGSKFGNKWTFGFWDCCSPFGTACFSCWCPCFLFGKTYDREHGKPDSSGCNMMCCAWACAASLGFNACLQCIMRGQMRERYNIDSNGFNDFCGSFCCPCCSLLQEEKESIVRNTGVDPTTKQQYQPVAGMQYA